MAAQNSGQANSGTARQAERSSGFGLALALGALALLGAGIAMQQLLERRLTRPEKARLRFYRYLRERGRLES